MVVVRRAEQPVVPWANGGGTTRQVAIEPPHGSIAGGFRWRVSQADVGCDGPFSNLPGIDRSLWLVRGNGMVLDVDGHEVVLDRPWQRFDFAGETPIRARLLDGPCLDLNVMSARAAVAPRAEVMDLATGQVLEVAADTALVLALGGELRCAGGWLQEGDAVRLHGAAPPIVAATAARVLVAAFPPRATGNPAPRR